MSVDLGEGTNGYIGAGCDGSTVTVAGGSGQDTLTGSSDGATREQPVGGGGDDTLQGYAGNDEIHGGEGADIVDGCERNDGVFGDGGNDTIPGRAGNDTRTAARRRPHGRKPGRVLRRGRRSGADNVRGGAGTDRLTLEDHAGGMTISLDDQAQRRRARRGRQHRTPTSRQHQRHGAATTCSWAPPAATTFTGNSGNDEIHGAGGDDDLYGGSGDDRMYGDAGNDKVQGANGADKVDGGAGHRPALRRHRLVLAFCTFDADQLLAPTASATPSTAAAAPTRRRSTGSTSSRSAPRSTGRS